MAFPAPALEQDITDHGNVIIEPYGFSTVGAMGSGEDNGRLFRQPVDQDIEKTPQSGSQNRYKDIHK